MDRKAPKSSRGNGCLSTLVLFVVTLGVVALLGISGYVFYLMAKLPRVDRLADYKPPIVSQVFGDDGVLVGEFYLERRIVVPVNKMPRKLIQAFVSAEDANFYSHKGIDYFGILRAAVKNIISMRKKEGASTITQQVTKSMLLTPEKKFSRKIKEAILATRMEEKLSKDEILYLYLNQIYLGAGSYGVQAAAETYFGKDVDQLNLGEIAMLAGLPKAPNAYSPIKHLDKARERQSYVLERMVKEGYVTLAEAEHAKKTPIFLHSMKKVNNNESAYYLEYLRIQLEEKYGEDQLYKGGLKIYTTMNAGMQRAAYESLRRGLKEVDKRQGFRGPSRYLKDTDVDTFCAKVEEGIDSATLKTGETYQGVVVGFNAGKDAIVRVGDRRGILGRKNMSWAGKVGIINSYGKPEKGNRSLTLGSVVEVSVVTPEIEKEGAQFALDQTPEVQAALVSIDPRTGGVKAMVGGYDFRKSQFNRAIQAKRNAGSAFKPIIYAAALDKGLTPATIIEDSEVGYPDGAGGIWKPKNYDHNFRGPVTMREALTHSINIVSVKILEQIGVQYASEYARKLGFTSQIPANMALALGAASISPFELTSAYAVFANKGVLTPTNFITRVTDNDGTVLQEMQQSVPVPVISPESAYVITNLMQSVVASGTGHRASVIGRPVAGKTGTTNESKDAWFIGYIPQLVTGVWVGYDQERSLGSGGTGGQAAAPIWGDFMQAAVASLPYEDFEAPENVSFVLINPRTGKLAREGTPGAVMECFIKGTEPSNYDSSTSRSE
ncbi:MAG: PBP1A family penicillin-binding protein [Desulfuromonadaceae bacterium]|nr:PBP1A family penicillin-binding protein [Desulfuromonadaceae bacterium]